MFMSCYKYLIIPLVLAYTARATIFIHSVSQDSISVGDRILFNVAMLVPKGSTIIPPPTENGFGKFTVKEWTTNKVEKTNTDSLTFNYIITHYSTEQCTLPPVPFVQVIGEKKDTFLSKPIPIRTVLVRTTDTTVTSILGLKPQQSVGSPSLAWLWIVLAAFGVFAIIFFLARMIKKRSKAEVKPPPKPPYEEAIEALALLEAKQYLLKGMVREYVFELSDIFKRYIERRFEVNAAEFTTEEMLDWIKVSSLEPEDRKICEWFFYTTDPVKFAKWLPDNDTLYRFGSDVRQFVERTKPNPQIAPHLTDKPNAA
jgi:hypothetical protein